MLKFPKIILNLQTINYKYLLLFIWLLGQSLILQSQPAAIQPAFSDYPTIQKWVEEADLTKETIAKLNQLKNDSIVILDLDKYLKNQQFHSYLNNHLDELDAVLNAENRSGYLSYLAHIGTDLESFYYVFRNWSFGKQKWSWDPYHNNLKKKFLVKLSGYEHLSYDEILKQILKQPEYKNMNETDAYLLFAYTTAFYYRKLNRWLRNGENQEKIEEIKNLLDGTLSKLNSIPLGTTCYRSLKIPNEQQLAAFLKRHTEALKRNEPVTYKEFLSVATTIEDSFVGRKGYNVNMYIQSSPNSKCKSIHDFAWGKYHFETLTEDMFMSGTRFNVIKIVPFGESTYYIYLKEI